MNDHKDNQKKNKETENADTPQQPQNETEKLQSQLATAEKRMEEYMDGWKRAKADYINLKKESEKKQQEMAQFANAALILQLLPIYDNFKLAWKHIPDDQKKSDWVQGIEQIKKQMTEFLGQMGIEEIKTEGEQFDPEKHEAVGKEKKDGAKSDTIIEEIKPGYMMHGKVLDPAKVKVAE